MAENHNTKNDGQGKRCVTSVIDAAAFRLTRVQWAKEGDARLLHDSSRLLSQAVFSSSILTMPLVGY